MIGKIVKVIDDGYTYSTYSDMAKSLKVSNWDKSNTPPVYDLYEIKAIGKHNEIDNKIVYIENIRTKKGYLIGIEGTKVIFKDFIEVNEFKI